MHKIVSKYGTAAHLGLLTAAPFFLSPLCSPGWQAVALLWLSLFAAIWVLMEPSRFSNEQPHEARDRVLGSIVRDPFSWFLVFLLVFMGMRAINGGVELAYSTETHGWSMAEPPFPLLPSSATGSAVLPLALTVALTVIFMGIRHALGKLARVAYLAVFCVLSGTAAIVLALALTYHVPQVVELALCGYQQSSFLGTGFGLATLAGAAALFGVVEAQWPRMEPFVVVTLAGNVIGLVAFAPPLTIAVFAVAFVLLAFCGLAFTRRVLSGTGAARIVLTFIFILIGAAIYCLVDSSGVELASRLEQLSEFKLLPEEYASWRSALAAVAAKIWNSQPWIGTGAGTFGMELRFFATAGDWRAMPVNATLPLSAWWLLICERGIVGALVMAAALVFPLWRLVQRIVKSHAFCEWRAISVVGLIALAAVVTTSFFDCSLFRVEVLMSAAALISISANSFPTRPRGE